MDETNGSTCPCSLEHTKGFQKAQECFYTSRLRRKLDDYTVVADIHNFGAKLSCEHRYRVKMLVPVAECL